MRNDDCDITFVLDRSGSMEAIKQDTIGGFNTFIENQKKLPGECRLTLVQFDHIYEFVHKGLPIKEVPPLQFEPRGSTALLDAIGRAINETGTRLGMLPNEDRPAKVVFAILTDGEENASNEFSFRQIQDMIKHQSESYNWQFVFLGANQDAIATASKIGVKASHAMSYAATGQGTQSAYAAMDDAVQSYRVSSSNTMRSFTDEERQAQEDELRKNKK